MAAFAQLQAALGTLGVEAAQQEALWRVLAGIYHLGAAGVCKGTTGQRGQEPRGAAPPLPCQSFIWDAALKAKERGTDLAGEAGQAALGVSSWPEEAQLPGQMAVESKVSLCPEPRGGLGVGCVLGGGAVCPKG